MLSKQKIKELKKDNNGVFKQLVYENKRNNAYLLNILENLGQLPKDFDGSWLPDLLESRKRTFTSISYPV